MSGEPEASPFLLEHLALAPAGPALDVACGRGRHTLAIARTGRVVEAVDNSVEHCAEVARWAVRERLAVRVVCADLTHFPLARRRYALVVNTLYLDRTLVPALLQSLLPGGLLIFETFVVEQLALGHPRSPEFVLGANELLRLAPGLRVLAYREGPVQRGGRTVHLASLAARAPLEGDQRGG
jgi:SAM-dependent methyltransferase